MNIASIQQTKKTVLFKNAAVHKKTTDTNAKRKEQLYYVLGALSVIGAAGLMYAKKKPKTNLTLIKTSTFQDLNSSLSKTEMSKLEQEFQNIDNTNIELFNRLKNSHQSDIFKRYYALSKMQQKRPIENPKLVVTDGNNADIEMIGHFFSKELNCDLKEIKYENTNLDEFLNLLDNLSTNASQNYNTNNKNTCLKILNFENLIKDYNENFDEVQQKRFRTLLANNQKNHIIYVGKESPEFSFREYDKMFLSFK